MYKENPKVIISGGGTGGHIFPAVAIANAIKFKFPDAEILFVGAKGKMEMEKVPKAGYQIKGLWISGIQRKLTVKNLSFPFKLISSLWNAHKIIKKFKPDIAIGVGGFASGPLLQSAIWNKIPTLIHESNSFPGITNKILGKNVNTICVAFPGMEKYFPVKNLVITGNPVRREILRLDGKKNRGTDFFKLNPNQPVLLVIGGSQGALSINKAIDASLEQLIERGYQLIWQTGVNYQPIAQERIKSLNTNQLQSHAFIYDMDLAYAVADLVVSRAGAMSIAELTMVKKPSVLVPFPYAAEDQQTKNALTLVNYHAAKLVKDEDAKELLFKEVDELLLNPELLNRLAGNIEKLQVTDATETILLEVVKLMNKNQNS